MKSKEVVDGARSTQSVCQLLDINENTLKSWCRKLGIKIEYREGTGNNNFYSTDSICKLAVCSLLVNVMKTDEIREILNQEVIDFKSISKLLSDKSKEQLLKWNRISYLAKIMDKYENNDEFILDILMEKLNYKGKNYFSHKEEYGFYLDSMLWSAINATNLNYNVSFLNDELYKSLDSLQNILFDNESKIFKLIKNDPYNLTFFNELGKEYYSQNDLFLILALNYLFNIKIVLETQEYNLDYNDEIRLVNIINKIMDLLSIRDSSISLNLFSFDYIFVNFTKEAGCLDINDKFENLLSNVESLYSKYKINFLNNKYLFINSLNASSEETVIKDIVKYLKNNLENEDIMNKYK